MNHTRPGGVHLRLVAAPAQLDAALCALAALGRAGMGVRLPLGEIGAGWSRSRRVLARVLGQMVDADIVGSRRGVSGGYWLSRPLVEVSVLEVVAALQNRDAEGVSDGDAPAMVRRVENLIARQLAAVSVWDVTGESERG